MSESLGPGSRLERNSAARVSSNTGLTVGSPVGLIALAALVGCVEAPTTRLSEAAASPLSDLNLVKVTVPPVLRAAHQQVYALPAVHDCIALATEIHSLDEVLGPDLDLPAPASDKSLAERGSVLAGNAALDAIKSAAEGLIPYRGWVRKLSGAERSSKDVAAAINAGLVRRGFLKGLRQAWDCR